MKPITRILVGVEFTDAGQCALNEASLVARLFGAEVVLLHSLPDVQAGERDAAAVVTHAERMLEKVATDLEADDIRVVRPFFMAVGRPPADALLAAIVEVRPDLTVLGAGTKTSMDRVIVGATAERVVRESPQAVWLTRPGKDHGTVERIVCAVDASAPAAEALAAAAFLARTFVAELHTLAVLPAEDANGDRALREVLARIDLHGIDHHIALRHGKPAVKIVEAASELKADLLVLGSARRTGVARLLHGNTAEKVLRQVPCSLLVVPAAAGPA